jgi:ABC-type branched-subunit amino acid transport system ATPase component
VAAGGSLLRVEGLTKRFGGIVAVDGVSFELDPGVVLGIIGPNGSGKTTLLNLLSGVHRPDSGAVWFRDRPLAGAPPHELVRLGIARTFQTPRVFQTVTVYQNMLVPMLHRGGRVREAQRKALDLLELVGLDHVRDVPASRLSGGQQKLVEFARALVTDPALVLMDEPLAGVHPEITRVLLQCIHGAREKAGTSFIIVSHEIPELMAVAGRLLCMADGRVLARGTPLAVATDPRVLEAYLGKPAAVL